MGASCFKNIYFILKVFCVSGVGTCVSARGYVPVSAGTYKPERVSDALELQLQALPHAS